MSLQIARPQSVTWLTVFVLINTGWQWFRFVSVLQDWTLLNEMPLSVSPIYLAFSSLIWGGLASALSWGLITGSRWALSALRAISLAYVLTLWIDRFLLQASAPNNNLAFFVLITLMALAALFWVASKNETRVFFGEHHE